MKIIAILLFIAMYVVMIAFPSKRPHAALITALLYILLGILPLSDIIGSIDWNVLMMLFGTMIIVDYFIESGMPSRLADCLLDLAPNVMWVTILMSTFAGIISAFIDNVATVLMVAPVALVICRKLKISPVPMVISIAVSSNLQGAATLVGDTTSIMLGAYAHMDFMDFFWTDGKPGMFFAVELGAAATIPIMMILFRKNREPVQAREHTEVQDYFPTFSMIGYVAVLICASFIPNKPDITNGLICCFFGILTILVESVKTHSFLSARHALTNVDYVTLCLLAGLFLVIGGVTNVGLIDDLADFIVKAGDDNLFVLYSIVVWGSVLISAFIDNIPYVATMLPVLRGVNALLGTASPNLLYYGLLTGATLGGNLTPIGASANIAAVGMLRKGGNEVSFRDFMRIGIPFTLTAVLVGYLFIWGFWH